MRLLHLVRAQLLAEAALYVAIGAWLHRERGWGASSLAAALFATALGARLALVCTSTALSHLWSSPRAPELRLGLAGTLRLVLGEWRAVLADNFWFLPFESIAMRPDPPDVSARAVPVLLVHGYLSNRGIFHALVRALEARGVQSVATFSFRGVFVPIEALVIELEAEVARRLAATGRERVILVCHSLGGLVARAWLARHGASRVAKLITIASPHSGTALAALGLGPNALQMRRGSEFLRELRRIEGASGPGCPATSIYTVHDNLVSPQDTSRLPWAKNVALRGHGHVAVLGAADLHEALFTELPDGN